MKRLIFAASESDSAQRHREAAMVVDADGNEIFFGETVGKCREYCENHNITGSNGEYIAIGNFYESDRYFDVFDYEEI